ncbi:MAG: hypothetical protein JWN73_4760 [Betaproteobacteria bacterium]|nr:hypothetical protein [Betaproteobacteria bacterium]
MPEPLLADYPEAAGRYDEMLGADGAPRNHWRALYDYLSHATPAAMRARLQSVARQVRENGITYNVYADPLGADRPWDLDVLPLILGHDEWVGIEAAVAQRATLLNRVISDIYSGEEVLSEGLLPPELVHGHAGFLRPCHGITPPDGVHLHVYAADLARSGDGRWWVLADRTQAPSGAGYALENRLVISRAFPSLFRDLKVRHLARFFATLRDSLAYWAPRDVEAPRIVLLTPGPYNETYYEHALLARYLGFPLVEGNDLTVREGQVWLKTLSGLSRVHVILRRLDDDYCDPLELRSDSALGIPGLTEAARRGNVLIANSLGSNLLESGTLLGFLPKLCERLLGEPLKMPSIGTWWCGEEAALEEVIEHLDDLVIKPAYPQLRIATVFGGDLKGEARAAFIDKLRAQPRHYVAQERVKISQAPVWDRSREHGLSAGAVGLRVYACATPNGYMVMPGGLARVATGLDERTMSNQRGGGSKDTWVLSTAPVSNFSLLRRTIGPQDLVRSNVHLSSRVAENLFWLGRYMERCDNTARLMRVTLGRLIDGAFDTPGKESACLMAICQFAGLLDHDMEATRDAVEARILESLSADTGLGASLHQLLRIAMQLRERLSLDNWRTLNHMLADQAEWERKPPALADALTALDRTTASLMTLAGFALDGMTRDQGWRFLSMGRRLERMQFLCMSLQQALSLPRDAELDWLLELADSIVTYRARYMARPEWLPLLDLLLLDTGNPRSIAFQLFGLNDYLLRLEEIYGPSGAEVLQAPMQAIQELEIDRDLRPDSERLLALLRNLQSASYSLSEHLGQRFFSLAGEANRQTFAT